MECIIPGANLKVLGKALQALSKVGDELFMEVKKETFSLVTLNSTKTVCARFSFLDAFFSSYEVNDDELQAAGNEIISCKIHMKIFLPLFRGNLEKKLDYVKMEYTTNSDYFIFKRKYKCDEILMVHKLRLMEPETLSIGVLKDSGSNNLRASSTFYNQLLAMFNSSDDEVTFEIGELKMVARNFCLGTPCRPKMMRTQINLNSTEFLTYRITKNTSINFSLKPFRTVVQFADNFNLDIDFNFEVGGKPLWMIMRNPTFEVNFIVATLDPYTESNSTVATTTTAEKQKSKPNSISDDNLEPMENWDSCNMSSKESSFAQLLKKGKNNKLNNEDVAKNDNLDVVPRSPESPRHKKARTVFGRCYDPTFHETILGEVLAANSDSE